MFSFAKKKSIPIPPLKMRKLVGDFHKTSYENLGGNLIFPYLENKSYSTIFDFGCGCGRLARKLMLQKLIPKEYVGIDLHRGMVKWCQDNLHNSNRHFNFYHYNAYNAGLNPGGLRELIPLPIKSNHFSLVLAISVFTHITETNVNFYLEQIAKSLTKEGQFLSTWFLFDKTNFPMMQEFQNSLYINLTDPTNAVIYDQNWLLNTYNKFGLRITKIIPPHTRGFQWHIIGSKTSNAILVKFPSDNAPIGLNRPPLLEKNADKIGLS